MGRTKRDHNTKENEIVEKLRTGIIKGKDNHLSVVPASYISRRLAKRKFNLTSQDLEKLDDIAVLGERNGPEGIYYPIGDISAMARDREHRFISDDMIPESTILKQIPRSQLPPGFLDRVRMLGEKGTKAGRKGRETTYYSKNVVETEFGCKVIPSNFLEYVDYFRESSISIDAWGASIGASDFLGDPELCIWEDETQGPGKAVQCFVDENIVGDILENGWFVKPTAKRPSRKVPQSN